MDRKFETKHTSINVQECTYVSTLSLHKKIEIYKTAPPVQEEGKIQMGKPKQQPSGRPAAKHLTVPSLMSYTYGNDR
jgi:hypothetical protein